MPNYYFFSLINKNIILWYKSASEHLLTIIQDSNNYALFKTNTFDTLRLLGASNEPEFIWVMTANGESTLHYDFEYVPENGVSLIFWFLVKIMVV